MPDSDTHPYASVLPGLRSGLVWVYGTAIAPPGGMYLSDNANAIYS